MKTIGIALVAGLAALTPIAASAQQPSLQGFSIVLVQGDQTEGAGPSGLPRAAETALSNMKDFLPFKGYRLMDSAWVLTSSPSRPVNTRLRGPDNEDYHVSVESSPGEDGQLRVVFRLQGDVGVRLASGRELVFPDGKKLVVPADADHQETLLRLRSEQTHLKVLEAQFEALTAKYNHNHPTLVESRHRLLALRDRIASLQRAAQVAGRGPFPVAREPSGSLGLIDTSFTMRIGETVVVGTSRVKGEQALIAVLTAVAQK